MLQAKGEYRQERRIGSPAPISLLSLCAGAPAHASYILSDHPSMQLGVHIPRALHGMGVENYRLTHLRSFRRPLDKLARLLKAGWP